nr:hypothetical protein [Kribbella pratensis]
MGSIRGLESASLTRFGFEDLLLGEDVPFAVGVLAESREDGEDPWTIHLAALDKDADRCRDPGAALDCGFEVAARAFWW